jgi:hypothetical protein
VPLTPVERSTRASIAALTRWSRQDTRLGTQPAQQEANYGRFEREVDPDGELEPEERARRVRRLRRAHMRKLALLSAQARRKGATR